MILRGTIETIRFYKPQDGFAIVTVSTGRRRMSAKGIMPNVRTGMTAEMTGEVVDTKYGPTFQASSFCETLPNDCEGIEKYLCSRFVKCIGPVLAKSIVKAFGEKTFEVMDNTPDRLREVRGIGTKRTDAIIAAAKEQRLIRSIMVWLKRYDIPDGLAVKIHDTYGASSVRMLEENPYRLADDIDGVGFKKADETAQRLGIDRRSPFRIRSGLIARLKDAAASGHTCQEAEYLARTAASDKYLDLPKELVIPELTDKSFDKVVLEDGHAALPHYHKAEKAVAWRTVELCDEPGDDPSHMPDFDAIERRTGFTYTSEQKAAVMMSSSCRMLILTGGPGTGKTATTNAIIADMESRGLTIELAAPTGRAAKRLSEVTGRPARTIHRMLEYRNGEFVRNAKFPISADAVIVDEASMIDTLLMRHLTDAVGDGTTLILVGDVNQLPSVGAGCVLRDLIDSGTVTTVQLTTVFRQAQDSEIIMNAHRINRGRMPVLHREGEDEPSDFLFIEESDAKRAAETVVDTVRRLGEAGFDPADIQVLSPMRKEWDPLGSTMLNIRLQELLNPDGEAVAKREDTTFRVGDRIMQVKNNYDKDLFNGDIGYIVRPLSGRDEDKAVFEADFEGNLQRFSQSDTQELELAYASTVHKAQGSEYRVVVMVAHDNHYVNLVRNLLYTGVTRAKELCIVIGTEDAIKNAVHRDNSTRRCTRLKEKIRECRSQGTMKETLF